MLNPIVYIAVWLKFWKRNPSIIPWCYRITLIISKSGVYFKTLSDLLPDQWMALFKHLWIITLHEGFVLSAQICDPSRCEAEVFGWFSGLVSDHHLSDQWDYHGGNCDPWWSFAIPGESPITCWTVHVLHFLLVFQKIKILNIQVLYITIHKSTPQF